MKFLSSWFTLTVRRVSILLPLETAHEVHGPCAYEYTAAIVSILLPLETAHEVANRLTHSKSTNYIYASPS